MSHHLFAPSAAHRWMVCTPYVAVTRQYPEQHSQYAAEGTVAHRMASTCLQADCNADAVWLNIDSVTEDGYEIPITMEMRENVQVYLDYVRGFDGGLEVEQKMESPNPDFGGTADALVWQLEERILHVFDLKYGKGVPVKAKENWQCICYAVLALARAGELVDIAQVICHIVQPRIGSIDSWAMTSDQLVKYAGQISQAIAKSTGLLQALEQRGEAIRIDDLVAGDHCRFCPHAAACPGLAEFSKKAAHAADSAEQLPNEIISKVLKAADVIDAWVAAVRQEAVDRALQGQAIDGYKLVQKRPIRKWAADEKVLEMGVKFAIDVYAPRVLYSPAQMELQYGKKFVADNFRPLIVSQSSGLTLVADDDKRPAVDPMNAAGESAKADFSVVNLSI